MLWGIGQYIGYPEKQDKAGALLHVVTDTGASFEKTDHIRGFKQMKNYNFIQMAQMFLPCYVLEMQNQVVCLN